ncbi:unnamed protein product [Gadus morhua 'NCC']
MYIYIQCKDITCLLFIADGFCETVTFIFDITVIFLGLIHIGERNSHSNEGIDKGRPHPLPQQDDTNVGDIETRAPGIKHLNTSLLLDCDPPPPPPPPPERT